MLRTYNNTMITSPNHSVSAVDIYMSCTLCLENVCMALLAEMIVTSNCALLISTAPSFSSFAYQKFAHLFLSRRNERLIFLRLDQHTYVTTKIAWWLCV